MNAVSESQVRHSVDHLFRHHAGQMVSVLCRIFGFERIDLIEDAVQDALVSALRKWPFTGIPDNQSAWLTQTAKNRLIDRLRHDGRLQAVDDEAGIAATGETPVYFDAEISEDQLRMIFACCHPSIPPVSQAALTLKIVGGFSVAEIASAFLANDAAVAKMLTRAKKRLRDGNVELDIPVSGEITARLDRVLKVLYLMFNEGYSASGGNELIRRDLCFEAIRLVELLSRHPLTACPKVHAAAALFLFQAARLPARTGDTGELILLADQDRASWDKALIGRGLEHMQRSASGNELTSFHLEAEIAAVHTLSPSYGSTNWERILECYTLLQNVSFSPVAELNRIIALSEVSGPEPALTALEHLAGDHDLQKYNMFHMARGHLFAELGQFAWAVMSFEKALSQTRNDPVRRFVQNRLSECRRSRLS